MHTSPAPTKSLWLNKVPEVTLIFWIIKMMSTTVGETAADYLNFKLHFGLGGTTLVVGILLAISMLWQLQARRYVPAPYWLAVVLISVFGTLVTDNLTDEMQVPLALSTGVFSIALIAIFAVWYSQEKTLSIHAIDTPKRERYYWTVILFTFALGTAAGDWVAEGMNIGYANAALLFGGLIAITAAAHYLFKANAVTCFWVAYVLTRPFGAACGDLLSYSASKGGLALGTTHPRILSLVVIIALVGYLSIGAKADRDSA